MIRIIAVALLIASPAFAQSEAIAPNSWLRDVWNVVNPLVTLFISIVGPVLVTWIAMRFITVLNITDENKRKELEQRIRDALHQSAANGLKFAMTKYGVTGSSPLTREVLDTAIDYVRTKNPDTARAAGVDDKDLSQIIMSKVPDVAATIAAAKGLQP